MALSRVVSEIFNVEKCRDLEIGSKVTQGHRKCYHSAYFSLARCIYIYETAHVVPPSADDMLRRPLAALVTAPVGRCRCDDLRDSKSPAAQPRELVHPRLGNSNNSINSRPTQRVRDYLLHLRLLCTYRRTIIYSCIPLGIYRRP